MSLELETKLLNMIEGAILSVDPKATFMVSQNADDSTTFDIVYKHDEMIPSLFEELNEFKFIVMYVGKHPGGLQFRVKAVNGEAICI